MAQNRTATIVIALVAALTIVSCGHKTAYSHYEHTPLNGWERNDTLTFHVPPVTHSGTYEEEVGLRINGSFPFTGLCLVVEQTILPENIQHTDTLNCRLIDTKGNVMGHGVSSYQYTFHLTRLNMSDGDSLRINVRHNMKREILPGISDIGIKLSRE